jgi:CRP-like cAMP-binding protein
MADAAMPDKDSVQRHRGARGSRAVAELFDRPPAKDQLLAAGEPLFHVGDKVVRVALVREGMVHLLRYTSMGSRVILQAAGPGEVVSEASAYTAAYHCGAQAVGPTRLSFLPVAVFRAALIEDPRLAEAWAVHLAEAVQSARARAEIRTLRTVTERVDAWLGEYGALPEKGHQQDLAAELGVTREALYRELARRRGDN